MLVCMPVKLLLLAAKVLLVQTRLGDMQNFCNQLSMQVCGVCKSCSAAASATVAHVAAPAAAPAHAPGCICALRLPPSEASQLVRSCRQSCARQGPQATPAHSWCPGTAAQQQCLRRSTQQHTTTALWVQTPVCGLYDALARVHNTHMLQTR
jgi:hypothetical protein